MRSTNTVISTVAAGVALSHIALVSAVPLERRGGDMAAFWGDLIGALGRQSVAWVADEKVPPCEAGAGPGEITAGEGNAPGALAQNLWAASDNKNVVASFCFANSTGSNDSWGNGGQNDPVTAWTQEDVDVAKCITDLHHDQNDVCISVKGSKCDTNGYTGRGGIVNNGAMVGDTQKRCGPPEGNGCRLDADQASSIKNGLDALVGQTMQIGHNDPYIVILNKDEFKGEFGEDSDPWTVPQQQYQFNLGPHVGC